MWESIFQSISNILNSLNSRRYIYFLTLMLFAILLTIIFFLRPNYVKIGSNVLILSKETKAGNIAVQSAGGTQLNAVLVVSAAGSRGAIYSPWQRTGIDVNPGDKIKIEASGSVNTALKRLIEIAQTDKSPIADQYQSWFDYKGGSSNILNDWDEKRKKLRLLPNHPYGAIVGAVWDTVNPVDEGTKAAIDEDGNLHVNRTGELVLAVNDLLLNDKSKDVYALPPDENILYYKIRLIEQYGEVVESWSEDKVKTEAKALYYKKLKTWEEIERYSRWTVWFDDNVGEFFVSITKTSPA